MPGVDGWVDVGFERVRDAFEANFEDLAELGGAFAVFHRGRPIVDLWGGTADVDSGRVWEESTATVAFSVTKGLVATCAHLLIERGLVSLDAPVAEYWREFAAQGKGSITVRQLLSHQAGVVAIDLPLSLKDAAAWNPVTEALATQTPMWEPGSAHGYHGVTYGWLVGELVARVSGVKVGEFLRSEVAGPLGLDMWIGLPPEHGGPVATLVPPPPVDAAEPDEFTRRVFDPTTLAGRAFLNPAVMPQDHNTDLVRMAELPSSNGIMTARSLAKLYASLISEVDGGRLLAPRTVAEATRTEAAGPDLILIVETAFALGYMRPCQKEPFGGRSTCFGHPGAGGSTGFADPESELAFGYVTNGMQRHPSTDPRASRLIEATYASLQRHL